MANTPTVAYGQLTAILGEIGYATDATRSGPGYVVFSHHGQGRLVTLPATADRDTVPSMYLNAIRGSLRLSLPEEVPHFDRLLEEAATRQSEGLPVG